ncbi:MAG: helix-turn-helix transcriptional regulator [Candidatus Aminicenantes bacterium]|nr:helix-turn-helix transcriptional regulator [Candidatus Aminicenantes bacterium]
MTQREGEVFLLILKGKRTKDIEKELFISYHTAKNHTHNIFQKLNVKNRLQAIDLLRNYLDNSRS